MIAKLLPTTALAGLLLAASASQAQTDNSQIPALQTTGALHYTCGGISSDESKAMRAAMGGYPLALLFARQQGEYLANLAVDIAPSAGPAMRFTADGPICLLKLPAGKYTVKATTEDGQTQSQTVDVGGQGRTLDFRY